MNQLKTIFFKWHIWTNDDSKTIIDCNKLNYEIITSVSSHKLDLHILFKKEENKMRSIEHIF